MNKPIEEKWKKSLMEAYPILYALPIAGARVQDRYRRVEGVTAGGDVFVAQAVDIESFIENLLEQERNRLTIKKPASE